MSSPLPNPAPAGPLDRELPFVSVIIASRNEKQLIGPSLDSIVASDYPKDQLEVLVVDGMSDDGTRQFLTEYARRHLFVRILDNPRRITPIAFNMGISQARGDLIMIMSAHATYAPDAISLCVQHSRESGADNVGCIWKILPRNEGLVASAICLVLSHRFGVGGARYRTIGDHERPIWVDTAAYGCYRREVFSKVGLFNENLLGTQDMEFNLRLKRAGGRTLLVPSAVIYYYARSEFRAFCKHNLRNGLWATLPFAYSEVFPVRLRHLTPLFFVMGLLGTGALALASKSFVWVFLSIVIAYLVANLAASAQIAWRERNWKYLGVMPMVFAALHVVYGWGSLLGLLKLLRIPEFWRKLKFLFAVPGAGRADG